MNIKEKFLELTSKTYPHGTEGDLFPILFSTVDGLKVDEFGNLFVQIGQSDVMFTSHLDTATSALSVVNHVFEGDIIKTDGKSILGADDKAGVTIMLNMIKNEIPGLYYFFLGEEVGCIGSKKVAGVQKENKIEGINKVISFDRRGTNSVITYQSSQRCCSDTFGSALSEQLNLADSTFKYENDPTGILTDSVQFIKIYSECTNISVGYQSEHTFSESQNIEHLTKLAEACLKVDWSGLPVERDPSKTEYRSYGSYGGYGEYGGSPGWDDYDYPTTKTPTYSNGWGAITKPVIKTENCWFWDKKYNYVSKIEIENYTNKVVLIDICKERIEEEKIIIDSLIKSLDVDSIKSDWDGFIYNLHYESGYKTECNRNDLIEYLPELDYKNIDELVDTMPSEVDDDFSDFCQFD
jgi:hypothetical protein